MTPIKSIKKELADCRAAFAAQPNATHAWCIHHEKELELIVEPIENRINFILKGKAEGEQAVRFRNLRPARNLPTKLVKAVEACAKADEARDEAGEAYRKAREAYDKADEAYAKARKAYLTARESCDKAWEARDKAGEAYGKAEAASAKAYAAYLKACEARANTREAYWKAREACEAQFSELHTRDWPDHTWNGKSIFP